MKRYHKIFIEKFKKRRIHRKNGASTASHPQCNIYKTNGIWNIRRNCKIAGCADRSFQWRDCTGATSNHRLHPGVVPCSELAIPPGHLHQFAICDCFPSSPRRQINCDICYLSSCHFCCQHHRCFKSSESLKFRKSNLPANFGWTWLDHVGPYSSIFIKWYNDIIFYSIEQLINNDWHNWHMIQYLWHGDLVPRYNLWRASWGDRCALLNGKSAKTVVVNVICWGSYVTMFVENLIKLNKRTNTPCNVVPLPEWSVTVELGTLFSKAGFLGHNRPVRLPSLAVWTPGSRRCSSTCLVPPALGRTGTSQFHKDLARRRQGWMVFWGLAHVDSAIGPCKKPW